MRPRADGPRTQPFPPHSSRSGLRNRRRCPRQALLRQDRAPRLADMALSWHRTPIRKAPNRQAAHRSGRVLIRRRGNTRQGNIHKDPAGPLVPADGRPATLLDRLPPSPMGHEALAAPEVIHPVQATGRDRAVPGAD